MRRSLRAVVASGGLLLGALARAELPLRDLEEPAPWQEEETVLPSFPRDENLREFYVSAVTGNRFFIDTASLGVGKDGVVRYVLVVQSAGGVTNITYEGIRCSSMEWKIYATGRQDGTWAKSRIDKWRAVENKQMNRHHATLGRELFCAGGMPIRSTAEGIEALRLGKHPESAGGTP